MENLRGGIFNGSPFAGGVSSGEHGIATLELLPSENEYFVPKLTARKSYFFMGEEIVALGSGITDTSVCMAAKAHLRGNRPLVIALASNDALSANLKNIATMLSRKFVYFVPLYQDDPQKKPHSLIADFNLLGDTVRCAMEGRQYQKIFK